MDNTTSLSEIKRWLPRGCYKEIAELTGLSLSLVNHVMAGTRYNEKILDAAISLAEKNKTASEHRTKRIKTL